MFLHPGKRGRETTCIVREVQADKFAYRLALFLLFVALLTLASVSISTSAVSVSAVVDWVGSGDLVGSAHGLVHTILVGVLNAVASAGLLGGVSASGVSVSTVVDSVSAVVESESVVSVSSVVESVSLVVSGAVSVVSTNNFLNQ